MKNHPHGKKLRHVFAGFPVLWFFLFLTGPLLYLMSLSLVQRGLYGGIEWTVTGDNYLRVIDPLYGLIFLRSIFLAAATTLICLLLSLPTAWAIVSLPLRLRFAALVFFVLPFVVNMISRIYAIRSVLAYDGPVIWLAQGLGLSGVSADVLSQNSVVVLFGMVTTYLPFMFFPIYVALEKMDFSQQEAAMDLGASPFAAFLKVVMPQIRPAVATGLIMVFVPSLGEFVIPDLLGGAQVMLAGNLVTEQFLKARDWPFGAALAMSLIAQMCLFIWLINLWGSSLSKRSR
ncbi:MAG: hypothetical protein ABS42_00330 [Bdellovibrio sp. SCN 50-8]|nr:MAG: hypothetical protein ABS42_00330 [Bdellovibrio sp. SCN 50-8]